MKIQDSYRFPPTILRLRRSRGISQKALALEIDLDGSRLSAFETGRLVGPPRALVQRIGASLRLSEEEKETLDQAGRHDRVIRAIAREIPPERIPLLALCLDAAWVLSDRQYAKVTTWVGRLVVPHGELAAMDLTEVTAMS